MGLEPVSGLVWLYREIDSLSIAPTHDLTPRAPNQKKHIKKKTGSLHGPRSNAMSKQKPLAFSLRDPSLPPKHTEMLPELGPASSSSDKIPGPGTWAGEGIPKAAVAIFVEFCFFGGEVGHPESGWVVVFLFFFFWFCYAREAKGKTEASLGSPLKENHHFGGCPKRKRPPVWGSPKRKPPFDFGGSPKRGKPRISEGQHTQRRQGWPERAPKFARYDECHSDICSRIPKVPFASISSGSGPATPRIWARN